MNIQESIEYLKERTYQLDLHEKENIEQVVSKLIRGIADYTGIYISSPVAQKPGSPAGTPIVCPRCGDPITVHVTP